MVTEQLEPRMELLREEYVLVQAWKKTVSYLRYHSWFADTLELDSATVNLPTYMSEIRERLQSSASWRNDPLRIVPAPKSQRWKVTNGEWAPVKKETTSSRLRPIAYVSLADQVVATALMLCLADRVETLQGDPRCSVVDPAQRKRVVSYGNRLFCDAYGDKLQHRWGAVKLYRAYFQDYRKFLIRSEVAAESISHMQGKRSYIVHADLRQFYDRVRPDFLAQKLDQIRREGDDDEFFSMAKSLLDWRWHSSDKGEVLIYSEQAGLEDFSRVALPQGLVAAGFFANVVLLSFDQVLRNAFGIEIAEGIWLEDACRYVDDMRLLIAVDSHIDRSIEALGKSVSDWLGQLLQQEVPSLALSPEKTRVAAIGGDDRPLVRQSAKMNRIQSAVSGGFDALGGEEILDGIQGLLRAQDAMNVDDDSVWRLSPVPDVRDETVARFGATRYRTTFRSIRPLLPDYDTSNESGHAKSKIESSGRLSVARSRQDLDDDARAFALGLIQRWIDDPSNVRLLRIGLDLWPDVGLLREVLSLLRPFTEKGGQRKAPRRVAWYCLAEVLRAGATETGLIADSESLPSALNIRSYREELCKEASRLVALPGSMIPWYLRQQALLFLAAFDPNSAPVVRTGTGSETLRYRELIRFLRGEGDKLRSSDFATLAVLARRAFTNKKNAVDLTLSGLSPARKRQIAERDPSFFLELIDTHIDAHLFEDLPTRIREDLLRAAANPSGDRVTLAEVVLGAHPTVFLRNELSVLRFARVFLEQWKEQQPAPEVITPGQVQFRINKSDGIADISELQILGSRANASGSLYAPPAWCDPDERWRFQLGFLLRFVLSGQPDFTRAVRPAHWKENESAYRPPESHWYQRLYGLFNGQSAFGDDWLPITDWCEQFLLTLFRWPGCRVPQDFKWVEQDLNGVIFRIEERINDLELRRGRSTGSIILPLVAKHPTHPQGTRSLRACVVQTAIPSADDFDSADLAFNRPEIRRKHRNHLSAALAAVERMLTLRETHKGIKGRLDWLILPELAVHPSDVRTHLIPFARAHKAIVLTGLTYESLGAGQPLVNSALWIIPEWSDAYGLQIRTCRQGKAHLAPDEQKLNGSNNLLKGFRPCQWLIGYPWSDNDQAPPLWLTAAVCYDSTDLGLAADLRGVSDVLAIPALNKDVKTFDQMALALHYHMFQLIVVANNGHYGGSNAYWPKKDEFVRQVFHSHGQPQASITFLEIDDIQEYLQRHDSAATGNGNWKYPPAGTKST